MTNSSLCVYTGPLTSKCKKMEESQNINNTQVQGQPASPFSENQSSGVSFPTVGQSPKKSNAAKTLLVVGILVLVGILGFVIFKSATGKSDTANAEPTPFDNLTAPPKNQPSILPSSTPVATPSAADKAKVDIQVQNGTGIAGEAAYLQTQLKNLGYTQVSVGNASSQDATSTQVVFSKTLDASVVAEITRQLNGLYATVSTSTSASTTFDVVITTGLRKGATPKPSATPVASPTASPSGTPVSN